MILFSVARHRAWVWPAVIVFSLAFSATREALPQVGSGRPSPWAACGAWREHISDLVDQHRTAHEMDDEDLGEVERLFYAAQSACSGGNFSEAFDLYDSLPLGRVTAREIR